MVLKRWRNKTIMGASLGAALTFFLAGIIFWGGFHTVIEVTNTQWFCTSCHEMQWVTEEYEERIHSHNPTGVGTTCADCHVPDSWGPKMVRKAVATRELWHWALGTMNTEEKFEERRLLLAERVWRSMLRTDSRECRNCHEFEAMDLENQASRAAREHERGLEQGMTCIECHQGIAHEKPDYWDESEVWVQHWAEAEAEEPEPATERDEPEPEPEPEPEREVADENGVVVDNLAAELDWDEIPAEEITLFMTGQASIEWMQDGSAHGGGRAFGFGDRCIWCHDGEEAEIGELITSGEKLETEDLGDKRGHVPMTVQTAFDDDHLYMRFQWEAAEHAPLPFVEDGRMDPDNPMKLTVSFADDRVEMADRAGCWASCHHDSVGMPDAPDEEALAEAGLDDRMDLAEGVTKYLSESRTDIEIRGRRGAARGGWDKLRDDEEIEELMRAGVYLDLARFNSGEERTESGYVLAERHFSDTEAVVFAGGEEDGTWTVYMTRALNPGTDADKALSTDGKYNIGIALHDDYAASRFHHVSWQYGLAFDAEIPGDFDDDMVEFNATRVD